MKKMMTTNTYVFNKCFFIDTPPSFDGERFELWKARFQSFIKVNDFEMWDLLFNDLFIPTFSFNDKIVNKIVFHWMKDDKRITKLGFKVKQLLIISLSSKEFCDILICDSAKEVRVTF